MTSASATRDAERPAGLETLRRLARAGLQNLEVHRPRIDDLNVYPVPDGDTGTNLVHTLRKIVEALEKTEAETASDFAAEISRVALRAGKGNSGVIFSQIVRGFASVLGTTDQVRTPVVARAFRAASDAAYRAVSRLGPVEGTILTVIREMAEAAEDAAATQSDLPLSDLLRIVLARGEDALSRTPEMLAILRSAGVVDAGGAGLVEIVRGVTLAANGESLPDVSGREEALGFDAIHQELSAYRYCTGFVVEGKTLDAERLEDALARLGDSLLVVGDEAMLKVHVHTDEPGAALALATAIGVIDEVEIANMHAQTEEREKRLLSRTRAQLPPPRTGIVALSQGEGARAIFIAEGAAVLDGGQTSNVAVGEIIEAIEASPSEGVVVLPNNSNMILAAEEAAKEASKPVRVVPSRSVHAGLAAIVPYLSDRSVEDNERLMLDALDSVVTGEITIAVKDAELDGISIERGKYFGLVDGRAVSSDENLRTVADVVLESLLDGDPDLLHIVTGEGSPPLDALLAELEREHPQLEIDVDDGGQPHYPLLFVAE